MIFLDISRNINFHVTVDKHIDTQENTCIISQDSIEEEMFYMTCDTCHKHYIHSWIRSWLQKRNVCPACNTDWTSNVIYRVPVSVRPSAPPIEISGLI